MNELLLKVLPLAIGSALSPGILAIALILLGHKNKPLLKTFSFLCGGITAAILIIFLGYSLGQTNHLLHDSSKTHIIKIIDLIIGSVLIFLGLLPFFKKNKENNKIAIKPESDSLKLLRWFSISFIINITNFDAVTFFFVACKEISSSHVLAIDKITATLISAFFFLSPTLVPFIFYIIAPKTAAKILMPINVFSKKYAQAIVSVIFIGFGLYLLFRS